MPQRESFSISLTTLFDLYEFVSHRTGETRIVASVFTQADKLHRELGFSIEDAKKLRDKLNQLLPPYID